MTHLNKTAVKEILSILKDKGVVLEKEIVDNMLTLERMQIVRAYMGFFNPEISEAEFNALREEGEHYYKLKHS